MVSSVNVLGQSSCQNMGQNQTSLNGIINYGPGNNFCFWIIRPCGASSVTLHFLDFSVKAGYDEVRIYSCSHLSCDSTTELPGSPFSGNKFPPDITSCTGIMKVQFHSIYAVDYFDSAFTATFIGYKPGDNSHCPGGGLSENSCDTSAFDSNQSISRSSTSFSTPPANTGQISSNFSLIAPIAPAACPIPQYLRSDIEGDCREQQCACVISTIESEENPLICNAYVDPKSPFRNAVINCLGRDCGEYQFLLVFFLLLVGGMVGSVYLFLVNGCTFRSKEVDEKSEGRALEECAKKVLQGELDTDQLPVDVDCGEGIEDGEMGVIAQIALNRLYQAALNGSEEESRAAKAKVAKLTAFAILLKKLGLKLILAVPLILQKNWIPSGAFLIDILVLMYCAARGIYMPGSLYNEVHVLVKGRRFVRTYHWSRFSLWMKFFVGFQVRGVWYSFSPRAANIGKIQIVASMQAVPLQKKREWL